MPLTLSLVSELSTLYTSKLKAVRSRRPPRASVGCARGVPLPRALWRRRTSSESVGRRWPYRPPDGPLEAALAVLTGRRTNSESIGRRWPCRPPDDPPEAALAVLAGRRHRLLRCVRPPPPRHPGLRSPHSSCVSSSWHVRPPTKRVGVTVLTQGGGGRAPVCRGAGVRVRTLIVCTFQPPASTP